MFKFNFSESDEISESSKIESLEKSSEAVKESKKIDVTADQYAEIAENVKIANLNCFISNEVEIGYLDNTLLTDESDTDLIPRIYEGGFKIWECTQDLADLFTDTEENEFDGKSCRFNGKSVCDLGCSAGVLGIIGLMKGADRVDFQDYNEDVLETFTIPNVVLSCEEREKPEEFSKCAFYSGDWNSFQELTSNDAKYDTILTSETIYNPENYQKLLDFFKSRLMSDGRVYLSAKSYYFGVSGNVLDFCKLLESDGSFSHESLWKSTEGVQREILLLKFKQ